MKCFSIAIVGFALVGDLMASDARAIPLAEVAQHAVEQAKLTLPGSSPFHLKATIVETTNPDSAYRGEIEEYWVSPEKSRRTISSPGFSQSLIVNGDQLSEQDKGDYFPWWLNDLVTAIFDPLPLNALDVLAYLKPPFAAWLHIRPTLSGLLSGAAIPPASSACTFRSIGP